MKPDVDRSSKIGEAILYAINQERYLRGYLEDGHLSIDNNAAERAIKNFAVGFPAYILDSREGNSSKWPVKI